MAVELFKRELHQIIQSIPGLLAILIIDRDGVPLIEIHQDIAPESAMQAAALSLTVLAADQASKLGFGGNNTICCDYDNYQVVTFNRLPMSHIVTLIADASANTGTLLALNSDFDEVLNELKKIRV